MPIDTSVYNNLRTVDFGGAIEKGLSLREMADQRMQRQKALQDNEKIKAAYAAGVTKNPDGSTRMVPELSIGQLTKDGFIEQAMALQQKVDAQKAQNLERIAKETNLVGQRLGGVYSLVQNGNLPEAQKQWANFQKQSLADGIDLGQHANSPFSPDTVSFLYGQTLDAKERLAQSNSDRDYDLKKQELQAKQAEARAKRVGGEGLPIDAKKSVETLATKNANKIAIKNQIDAVMANWDKLPDDQKVATGRQLIKTLNSTEGSDAVGAEESKRLGGKLEFAIGNLTNSNPVQFGRDLEGFKTQALNVSSGIGKAVESNQSEIDRLMGRKTAAKTKTKFDSDVIAYAKKHGISNEDAAQIKADRTQVAGK